MSHIYIVSVEYIMYHLRLLKFCEFVKFSASIRCLFHKQVLCRHHARVNCDVYIVGEFFYGRSLSGEDLNAKPGPF